MNKHKTNTILTRLRAHGFLTVVMLAVGGVTLAAVVSTYEVILGKDIERSNVIRTVSLTSNQTTNNQLVTAQATAFNPGTFGTASKIKFPETKQHIAIEPANHKNGQWKASQGVAHTFITHDPIEKMFGRAVIYLRYNTPTTKHLGDALVGDVVNIITTQGWQLGFRVTTTASDISQLEPQPTLKPQIVVITINDQTNQGSCFIADLYKVGERL